MGDGTPEGGNLTGGEWRAQLSDTLKTNEAFTPYKTVSDFAQAHLDTVGKVRDLEGKLQTALFVPGENATEEERTAFFTKMGRPETADGYALSEFPVPQGLTNEEAVKAIKARAAEDVTWFRGLAHKLGMPKGMAEAVFSEYAKRSGEYFAVMEGQRETALTKAMETLKADPEWAGENFQKNLVVVNKAMEKFGSPELKAEFDASGLGNNPAFVKFFYSVGKAMGEDRLVTGTPGGDNKKGWHYPSLEEK